jgi:hypothetical protein
VLKTTVYVASARQQDLIEVWDVVHAGANGCLRANGPV